MLQYSCLLQLFSDTDGLIPCSGPLLNIKTLQISGPSSLLSPCDLPFTYSQWSDPVLNHFSLALQRLTSIRFTFHQFLLCLANTTILVASKIVVFCSLDSYCISWLFLSQLLKSSLDLLVEDFIMNGLSTQSWCRLDCCLVLLLACIPFVECSLVPLLWIASLQCQPEASYLWIFWECSFVENRIYSTILT